MIDAGRPSPRMCIDRSFGFHQNFIVISTDLPPRLLFFTANLTYLGTLNMAMRLLPKLKVWRRVPRKTRFLPFVVANRQPFPPVILSPFLARWPLIVISFAICCPIHVALQIVLTLSWRASGMMKPAVRLSLAGYIRFRSDTATGSPPPTTAESAWLRSRAKTSGCQMFFLGWYGVTSERGVRV